jgi:hypothetical protein
VVVVVEEGSSGVCNDWKVELGDDDDHGGRRSRKRATEDLSSLL